MPLEQTDLAQLSLIHAPIGQSFCDQFIAKLLSYKMVADIASTNKVSLSETKRDIALQYIITGLSDAAGFFFPSGTLAKAATDLSSRLISHERKKRYAFFSRLESNHVRFALLGQALVNTLLVGYGTELWANLTERQADDLGRRMARELVHKLKDKNTMQIDRKELSTILQGLYQLTQQVIQQRAPNAVVRQTNDKIDYADILIVSSAQLLGLPDNFFTARPWEVQLDALKVEMDNFKRKLQKTQEENKALIEFSGDATIHPDAQVRAQHTGTQLSLQGTPQQLKELSKLGLLDVKGFMQAEKPSISTDKEEVKTLILFKGKADIKSKATVVAVKIDVSKEMILTTSSSSSCFSGK